MLVCSIFEKLRVNPLQPAQSSTFRIIHIHRVQDGIHVADLQGCQAEIPTETKPDWKAGKP